MKIKHLFLSFFISITLINCSTTKHRESLKYSGQALIKQLAFSKCMDYCLKNGFKTDTFDYSTTWVNGMLLDYYWKNWRFYAYKIRPTIDSIAKRQYLLIEKSKYPDEPVAEAKYGHAAYTIGCLDLYNSTQLDSIAKALDLEYKKTIRKQRIRIGK